MAPRLAGKPNPKPAAKKKTASNVHKLPDTICEGEILRDIQKRQWRIGKSIGVGGFGEIYAGRPLDRILTKLPQLLDFSFKLSDDCFSFFSASDVFDKPVSAEARYVIKIVSTYLKI